MTPVTFNSTPENTSKIAKSSISNEAIGTIVGAGALLVLTVAVLSTCKLCKKSPPTMENDDNPTYGDYADYSEPVVEVEDSNVYYGEGEEEDSRAMDRNSNYEG